MRSPETAIAYILGTFPTPSQTFIAREVRGLLAAGVPLHIFSLRRRAALALEPPDREWFHLVRFAPLSLSPPVLAANAHFLRRDDYVGEIDIGGGVEVEHQSPGNIDLAGRAVPGMQFDSGDLREGVKAYSQWPTIPQLYVKGEFVGGCDIIREMFQAGELQSLLKDKGVPVKEAAQA